MSDTKTLIFKINGDLKHRFKLVCLKNKMSQQDAIESLVKYYVNRNGELKEKAKTV